MGFRNEKELPKYAMSVGGVRSNVKAFLLVTTTIGDLRLVCEAAHDVIHFKVALD